MLKLVKTPEKPRPQLALTMAGPAPVAPVNARPALTFAQEFSTHKQTPRQSALRLAAQNGQIIG